MKKFVPGFIDPRNSLMTGFRGEDYNLVGEGTGAPTNGVAGWQTGAIWHRRDGGANTAAYINVGTELASSWVPLPTPGAALTTPAGAGITGGTGTIYESVVGLQGTVYTTTIYLDLTGLGSSTTDLDIIGVGASAAHLGRITTAQCGAIFAGVVTCLEAPATGVTDIDFYSAAEGTGVFDGGIAALTETALVTSGGAWTNGASKGFTASPAASDYLYVVNGAAGTVGTYTAGIFRIQLFGR